MRGPYLHHLTMTTAHSRKSYRDEVDDAAVAWGRAAIQQAVLSGPVPLPPLGPDWRLGITRETSKALLCSVWWSTTLAVTFGVAGNSKHGARLWRALVHTSELPVVVAECPPEPWVVARLEPGALMVAKQDPGALGLIGDMERCVGWAFLEMLDGEKANRR